MSIPSQHLHHGHHGNPLKQESEDLSTGCKGRRVQYTLPLVLLRVALGPAHCVQGLIPQMSGRSKGDAHVPGHLPSGLLNPPHLVTASLSMFPLVKLIHLEGLPG